tara:strand:+ start:92 stop:4339 length:4248 start_codon:yes stop_codon:yes gene_type:complete
MRNYEQVRNSDAVIAVVKEFRNKAPVGGTGAAVAMGIQKGIPVHVFDENNERWVTYDAKQDDWFETLRPPFYKNFAAVGSRKIAEDSIGHDAIKDYMGALEEFQKGSETFGGEVERTTNIPVVPDHIKDYFDKKLEGTEDRSNMSEDEQRRSDMAATQQPPEWNASVDEDTLKSIRARKLSALRGVEKEVVEAKKLLDEARETLSNADEGDREEAVYEANIRRQKHDEAVQQRASAQREAEGALADIKAFRKQPRSPKPTKAEKTEAARQKKLDDNPMNSPEARKVQPRPEFEHNPILEISDNDGKPFESFGKGLGGGEDISEASDTYSTEGMAILLSILHGTASGGDSNVSDINYERPAMPDDKTLTGADLAVLYSEYGNEENKDKHFGVKEVLEDYFQYHIATDRLGKNNILSRITEWIGDWEEGNYLEFVDWIGENFSPEGEPAYRSNRGEAVSSGSEIHHMYGNDKVNFDQLESENSPAGKLKAQRKRMKSREDQREEADVEWLGLSVEQRLERSQQWLDDHRDVFASMLKSTTTSEDGTVTEIPGMSRGEKIFLKNVGMYTPQFENEEYTPKDNPLRDLNFALLKESLGWRNQNGLRKEFGFDMIPDPDQKEAMDLYRKTNGKEGAKYNPKLDKRKPGEKWHLELGDFMGVAKAVDLLVSNPTKYLNTDENYTNPAMMRKIEEIATHRDNMSPEEQDWWTSLCEKGADRRTDVFTGRRTEWFKELFLNPKGIPAAMGRIAFNFQDYRDKDNPFKGEKSPDEHWREALADVTEQRRRSQLRGTLERGTGYMDGDDARPNSFFGGEKSSRQNTDDVEALFVRALDDKFRGLDTFRALIGGQGFRDKVRLKLKAYRAAKEQLDTRASSSYGDPQAGEMYEKDYAALADMGNYDLRAAFHQLQHDASINTHVMSQDSSIAALDSIPSQYRLFAGADERQDYVRAYTAASYSGREAIRDAIATGGIVNAPEFIASVGEKFDPKFDSLYNEKAKGYAEVAGMVTGHIANNREYDDATDSVVNQDDLNDVNEEIDEIELDIKAATNEEQPYDEDKMTDLRADLRDARRRKKDIESNETALNDSGGSEQYDTLTLNRRAPTAEAQQAEVRTYHDIEAIMENLSSKKPYPTKGNREVNPYHAVRGDIDTQWVDNRNAFLELLRGLPEDKQTTFITDLIEAYESGRPPKGYSAVRTFEPGSGTQAGEQMTFRGALRDPVIDLEIEESTSEVVQNKKHGFQMGALADLIYSTLHSMGERRYDPKLKENVAGRNTSNLWDRMADAKLLADTKGDYETLFSASRNLKVKQQRSEMEAIMRKHPAAQLLPDFEDNLSSELDRYTQLRSPEGLKEGLNTHYSIGKLIKNGKKKDGTKYNSVDDVINGDLDRKHDAHIEANPEQQPSQAQPQPSGQPIDQQPTTEA